MNDYTSFIELLDTLGQVPWTELRLNSSIDSLRICQLASPSSLVELHCFDVRSLPARAVLKKYWRRLIAGKNLEKLVVPAFSFLDGVVLSSNLKFFGVKCQFLEYMTAEEFPDDTLFPESIRSLSVMVQPLEWCVLLI